MLAAVAAWPGAVQSDTLGALEVARDYLRAVRQTAAGGDVIVAQVAAANLQREQLDGLEWDAQPSSITYSGSVTSAALVALAKHRELRRRAVPVP
jgi:hypothetical protein